MSSLGGGLAIAFLLSAPAPTLPHAMPAGDSTAEPPASRAETALSRGEYSDCTPDTTVLVFDGGYGVSLCYETAQGTVGDGKAGIWASAESGIVWFFSRENAEMLIKVLNGCAHNGYRWVFVAPVTDVAFNLHVTSSRGNRWIYRNRLGETAATSSDVTAFRCATDDTYGADLAVRAPSVSDADLEPGQSFSLQVLVDNRGDDRSAATTLSYYRSRDSTITTNDRAIGTDPVSALVESGTAAHSIGLTAPSSAGTYYYGACVDPVSGEANTANNCSSAAAVRVGVPEAPPALESGGDNEVATGDTTTLFAEVAEAGDDLYSFGAWSDDEDVAVVAEVRASKSGRLLAVTGKKAGKATITVVAVNSRGEPSGLSTFDALVTSPTANAPALETGSNDDALEVTFRATFRPLETRAYDYQVRLRRPQTAWTDIGCQPVRNSSSSEATGAVSITITGLRAGTTYEARYRSRRSSSCTAGSPGLWSAVGHGTTSGTAINSRPEFAGATSVTVSVKENAGDEVNVGSPVAADDADGLRDILTYSLSGPDAASFQIVPETGQIRTRAGRTYDFESRSTYNVTVEARDVHDETASLPVTIDILDLEANCSQPPRLRLNPRDGLLVVRWTPLEEDDQTAAVLGYEIEWRAGSSGAWTNRVTVPGRENDFAYLAGLTNLQRYYVRIRPFGPERACGWSEPVSGIPQTDRSPLNDQDFEDRLGPGGRLGDRRFPAPGRFSERTNGRHVHGSYDYEKTEPDRGLITLEYDEVGRSGCSLSLLFSSLTSGSFLDECGDAGVNTDFDLEETPPEPENLAPRSQEEFEVLAQGRPFLPGVQIGGHISGTGVSIRLPPGFVAHTGPRRDSDTGAVTRFGRYEYQHVGPSRAQLILCFTSCTEDPEERWVIDLEFISSDAAKYTITVHRKGHEPLTLDGFIDFKNGDYLSDFPPELVPPRHPPQAAGRDLLGIDAASGSTSLSIGADSLQTILLRGEGIQDIAYSPGDWLEPKDGGNQRMMIVGAGPVAALATGTGANGRTGASDGPGFVSSAQTDLTAVTVVCMQREKGIPTRGSRYFSQPKAAEGAVQLCQRDCVRLRSDLVQGCVWQCERTNTASAAGLSKTSIVGKSLIELASRP
ncbi:MAG: fibronectin type III domain-containing protein [Acidobacteria bacterium]|nr:fibronectin type III domain-containing protein [Acidobacteriota bacterium]